MKEPLDEGERGEWNIWQANVCLIIARVFSEQDPVSLSVQTNAAEGAEKRQPSYTAGGNVNWYRHDGEQYAAAKSLQSCPTLCDPIDGSPPGSPVPGILQVTQGRRDLT